MVDPSGWQRAADPARHIGRAVEAHERVGSTNDRARELLLGPNGEGVAVVAEEQLAGRGRRGRRWSSPPGVNLMVSVGVRPRVAAADAWQLGLAVALAARDACAGVAPVELKWPNDLVARDGRKLGGVLVETAIDDGSVAMAVIGIGINVNWRREDLSAEIRESATSLLDLAGEPVDRIELLSQLLRALDREVASVEAGSSPLERYRDACRTLGTEVTVVSGEERVVGTAIELDPTGSLVVETRAGRVTLASGEVHSVRGAVPA